MFKWICKYILPSRGDEEYLDEEENGDESDSLVENEPIQVLVVESLPPQQPLAINRQEEEESPIRRFVPSAASLATAGALLFVGGSLPLIIPAALASFGGTYFFIRRNDIRHIDSIVTISDMNIDMLSSHGSSLTRGATIFGVGASSIASWVFAFVITDGGLFIFLLSSAGLSAISSSLIRHHNKRIRNFIEHSNLGQQALSIFDNFGRRISHALSAETFFEHQVENAERHPYGNPDRPSEAVLRGEIQNRGLKLFAVIMTGTTLVITWPVYGASFALVCGLGMYGVFGGGVDFWFREIRGAQSRVVLNEISQRIFNDENLEDIRRQVAHRFSISHPEVAMNIIRSSSSNDPAEVTSYFFESVRNDQALMELLRPIILGVLAEHPQFAREILEAGAYVHGGDLARFYARFANIAPEFLWLIAEMPLALLLRVVPERARGPLEIAIGAEIFRRADDFRLAIQAVTANVSPENVGNAIADNSLFNRLVRVVIYSLINLSLTIATPWATLSAIFGQQAVVNISFGVGGIIWGIVSSVLIYIKLPSIDALVLKIIPNTDRVMVFFGHSEGHTVAERNSEREYVEALHDLVARGEGNIPQSLRCAVRQRDAAIAAISAPRSSIVEIGDEPVVMERHGTSDDTPIDDELAAEEGTPLLQSSAQTYGTQTRPEATSPLLRRTPMLLEGEASGGRHVTFALGDDTSDEEEDAHGDSSASIANLQLSDEEEDAHGDSSASIANLQPESQRLNDISNHSSNYSVWFQDKTPRTINLVDFSYDDYDDRDDDLKPFSEEKEIFIPGENIDNFYDLNKENEVKLNKKDTKQNETREEYEQYFSKDLMPNKDLYDVKRSTDFLQIESYGNLVTPIIGLSLLSLAHHHIQSF